jgi:hypothetical protein
VTGKQRLLRDACNLRHCCDCAARNVLARNSKVPRFHGQRDGTMSRLSACLAKWFDRCLRQTTHTCCDHTCCDKTHLIKWSFDVRHKGTGNDCRKGRHFAMTKNTPPQQRSMGRHTCGAGRQQLLLSSSSSLVALQGAQVTLGVWIVTGGAKILKCLPLIIFAVTANSLSDVRPRRERQPLANQNTQSRASLLCCSCVSMT